MKNKKVTVTEEYLETLDRYITRMEDTVAKTKSKKITISRDEIALWWDCRSNIPPLSDTMLRMIENFLEDMGVGIT